MKVVGAAAVALVLGFFVEKAKADEAFVCEGGRLVKAKSSEIEALKHTDACVAAHFGMKVHRPSPAAGAQAARIVPEEALTLVAERPEPDLRPAPGVPRVISITPPQRSGTVGAIIDGPPPMPSDHRNVRLINPAPGTSPYYHHRR